ncbi:MAG: YhcH/YjgK/YiaL family protein [Clostridiales bacterium]|nr:YhcH/YjgK/YiaL family protein [Clostridiales bacterium]
MIIDRLVNRGAYTALGTQWDAAFEFLEKCQRGFPAPGRYEIDGDRVFASVQQYETSPAQERSYEAHARYIDIQFICEGIEYMGYAPADNMKDATHYDSERDCLNSATAEDEVMLCLRPGMFAVFFPQDAHKPGCQGEKPETVKKAVIKLRFE